jgi:hypothetical protein
MKSLDEAVEMMRNEAVPPDLELANA